MVAFRIYVIPAVSVFIYLLVAGKINPPENLQVNISGNSVRFTWTIPEPTVSYVELSVLDSEGKKEAIDLQRNLTEIQVRNSSFETTVLPPCEEYTVQARSYNFDSREYSDIVTKKFWLTAESVTGSINTDVTVSWKTAYMWFVRVIGPRGYLIYVVDPGGNIILNDPFNDPFKYRLNTTTYNVQDIEITVTNVKQTDGGIYKSISSIGQTISINECCLLIIADKPTKPVLKLEEKDPVVGDDIRLTCKADAQRWPIGAPSSLTYRFFGRGVQQDEKLIINNLTFSDKDAKISCQAVDDLGKMSDISNIIILDPFCGPKIEVSRDKIGAQRGTSVVISLFVVSNPKPNITWDSKGDNLDAWNIQFVKGYQYNATSSVRTRTETDFHQYTLCIWNTVGVTFQSIAIVPRGKPDQPRYFDYGKVTFEEVDLSWVAGFDNGGKQNFIIYFKSENEDKLKSIRIPGWGTREGTRINYTLTGLLPKTSYYVYLLASNEYGTSNSSLNFTTKDIKDKSEETSTITWISCLVVVVVIAGLSHFFRTYIKKVSRNRNLINERKTKNVDDFEDHGIYEKVEGTAIVSLKVPSKETSEIIGNTAADGNDSSSMDSEGEDNKNADVEQELPRQEQPYYSLEENWRCNTHTYGDTSNCLLKSAENIDTYESIEDKNQCNSSVYENN